jgi:tellurite resistance protein
MEKHGTRYRFDTTAAEMMAAYWEAREDELVDAVVTAAALVARADGRVDAVERERLLDFLDRDGILSAFARAEIRGIFERRVREQGEPRTVMAALRQLGRHAEHPLARVIIDAGEEITASDSHIDPRERRVLQLLRIVLSAPATRSLREPIACRI